jgi:hypothetical protein
MFTPKFLRITPVLLALSLPLFIANVATAHTVAIGWSTGASAGEVNLFMGSYHQNGVGDGTDLERAANLVGPGGYNTTTGFDTTFPTVTDGTAPSTLPLANIQFASGWNLSQTFSGKLYDFRPDRSRVIHVQLRLRWLLGALVPDPHHHRLLAD